MSSPAEIAFKCDRTLNPAARRVYDYLTTVLDFVEVRQVRGLVDAERAGVHRNSFGPSLDALVARGYLLEHERGERNVRHFTLIWSLRQRSAEVA